MSRIEKFLASRTLTCVHDGLEEQVTVLLAPPVQRGTGEYTCGYRIAFAGKVRTHHIAGIDGIQGIQLALFMIGSALASLPQTSNWRFNNEPGTGFPSTLDDPIF